MLCRAFSVHVRKCLPGVTCCENARCSIGNITHVEGRYATRRAVRKSQLEANNNALMCQCESCPRSWQTGPHLPIVQTQAVSRYPLASQPGLSPFHFIPDLHLDPVRSSRLSSFISQSCCKFDYRYQPSDGLQPSNHRRLDCSS